MGQLKTKEEVMPVEFVPREETRAEYEQLLRKHRRLLLERKVLKRDYRRAKKKNTDQLRGLFHKIQLLCTTRWAGGR